MREKSIEIVSWKVESGCASLAGREVAAILAACRVHWDAVNVLTDHNAEEGIKEYTGDPRLPLVFLAGQLLGGVADLRAAYTSGQLELLLHQAGARRTRDR